MKYDAIATLTNEQSLVFELEDYQVDDFMFAVANERPYKDSRTGVISWLPPRHLHHILIKPNLESPKCQKNQPSGPASDLLT